MSSSASHALSEVKVFCAEKDSGFFAALRMTQKKRVPARVAPAPTSGYAKLSYQAEARIFILTKVQGLAPGRWHGRPVLKDCARA
jgi:hypothetical protein